jgi:glycosyltransferase involved in cell wall biosynthesis
VRICHVSPHLPPDQAANALLPAHLGRWSNAVGHQVSFITQAGGQGASGPTDLPGPVRRTRARSTATLSRWLRIDTLQRSRSIGHALDDLATGAHLLHLHSNGLIVEVAARWARRRRMPFVLTLYGTEIWHYRRRPIVDPFTAAYQSAEAVTFYSRGLLDRARELGLDRRGMHVIYPAVSETFAAVSAETRTRWRRELGINEPRVILNVKRLHPLAGQKHLVAAFARLAASRSDVRLVICGTGPLRTDLERQARDLGVAGRVTFAGLVPNDAVARYAAVADIFALPSELEALPTVAVEALAAGTPVVSTDHPGGTELHELFGDDVQVVPRGDVDQLTMRLAGLLDAPRRTSRVTHALVDRHFGPAAVRDAYHRLYGEIAGPVGGS